MFRKLHDADQEPVMLEIDGKVVVAEAGETVAAVLLRQEQPWCRLSARTHEKRAPYCMMGVCFDCLACIDGVASVQTCQVIVRDGMRISRQTSQRGMTN